MENHGCQNFISLAGPLSGVYGFHLLDNYFPNLTERVAFLVLYTDLIQKAFSFAGYWYKTILKKERRKAKK
jgi:hypothetical protein